VPEIAEHDDVDIGRGLEIRADFIEDLVLNRPVVDLVDFEQAGALADVRRFLGGRARAVDDRATVESVTSAPVAARCFATTAAPPA
jgi:hypothetical protein